MASPLASFRHALASTAVDVAGIPDADKASALEALLKQIRIPEAGRGDLALPAFDLARRLKLQPPELAKRVADAAGKDARWARVEAVGPYVNVHIAPAALAGAVLTEARKGDYGTSEAGRGRTVVIDFSSPNIAKPLAFHHIRSTVIGAAIGRLHAAQGWKVVGINYLGDWGKQFGLLATGFRRYGDPKRRADAKHLVEVYVKANRDADVEGRKAAIAAPEEVRKQVAELTAARAEAEKATDPKAKKSAEGKVKGLEKKLRARRGMESGDPLTGLEAWYAELDAEKKKAEAELPEAEARDREARLFLKRLEEGEKEALAEWKEYRETSVAEFERVYKRMGIQFHALEGESFYTHVLEDTVKRVAEKPGTRISEGATVVDLPYKEGEPPVILKTRDGTTLYVTRDIAAAMDRHQRFNFDRSLYVVAADQSLHFDQLKRTLGAMGFPWAERISHIAFGRVHGMSTRRGNVVFLDEVLDEAVQKAREICEASEKIDRSHLDETVEAIGVGAVVFGDLRNLRMSDYTFKLEEAINFDGFSGPYIQFSHARACSIIKKGGGVPATADTALLKLEEERAVILALASFPDVVAEACESFEPSLVTRAIMDIAQATASYLTSGNQDRSKRVLLEDPNDPVRAARLHLMDAVRNTLARGLALLGVRAPEAM
ncbi:MAG: arginine--tRNA ligase [Myxococcota bacterium]